MSDATDYAAAFAKLKRAVQPDLEPALTYGDGTTADPTQELDAILLNNKVASTWAAGATVTLGSVWMPTTRTGRRYEVVTAGTFGATEPSSWPTDDYGTVTSGTATLREAGGEYANVYDVRAAIYEAFDLKVTKAASKTRFVSNGQGQANDYLFLNLQRQRDRYLPVGVA